MPKCFRCTNEAIANLRVCSNCNRRIGAEGHYITPLEALRNRLLDHALRSANGCYGTGRTTQLYNALSDPETATTDQWVSGVTELLGQEGALLHRVLVWARGHFGDSFEATEAGVSRMLDDLDHDFEVAQEELAAVSTALDLPMGSGVEGILRALDDLRAVPRPGSKFAAYAPDPFDDDYDSEERAAIEHEPTSVWTWLRRPLPYDLEEANAEPR